MRQKEMVKMLESMVSLNEEDKFKRDMIVDYIKEDIRTGKYMVIGLFILGVGIFLGWFFGVRYPQWNQVFPKMFR